MISFSTMEIFLSVILFIAYGAAFAVIYCLIVLAGRLIALAIQRVREMHDREKIFSISKYEYVRIRHSSSASFTVICVFLFTVGFILTSYLALDGEIRLYSLILVFASFYLSKFAFFGIFEKIIIIAFDFIFMGLLLLFRVIITPFKLFVSRIKSFTSKNTRT